jgi:glycyl-tRNA synthetase alpha chain
VFDLKFNSAGVTYGEVFLDNEKQMSAYHFEVADTEALFDLFRKAAAEAEKCLTAKLPIPAYEQAIKASHVFNMLQARGVISVAERQAYIGRVRDLAKGACAAWMEAKGWAA